MSNMVSTNKFFSFICSKAFVVSGTVLVHSIVFSAILVTRHVGPTSCVKGGSCTNLFRAALCEGDGKHADGVAICGLDVHVCFHKVVPFADQ
eukprot:506160-Amphidinium_carterae.1